MSANVDIDKIEFAGLKEALRALNGINRAMRLQVTLDYKEIVKPVLEDIKAQIPLSPPMSGWQYKFRGKSGADVLPWKGNERAMLKPYISGKKPKQWGNFTSNLSTFGIRWSAPSATMFDLSHTAKTPQGYSMIDTLNSRISPNHSRIMYSNWEKHKTDVEKQMVDLANAVMARVQKEI